MTQTQTPPYPPQASTQIGSDDRKRHIVAGAVRPGETVSALCGKKWRVEEFHGPGVTDATCEACIARYGAG